MNWKKRLTNYNFWISIVSAVLLILQAFDISFDIAYINEIVTAVLGLLVVIGIINDPAKTGKDINSNNQTSDNNINTKNDNEDIESNNSNEIVANNSENDFNASKEVDTEKINVNDIPNQNENENNIINSSNDYEVLVDKIYSDLNEIKNNFEKIYATTNLYVDEKIVKDEKEDNKIQENLDENVEIQKKFDDLIVNEYTDDSASKENIIENNSFFLDNDNNINNFSTDSNSQTTQTAFKIVNN